MSKSSKTVIMLKISDLKIVKCLECGQLHLTDKELTFYKSNANCYVYFIDGPKPAVPVKCKSCESEHAMVIMGEVFVAGCKYKGDKLIQTSNKIIKEKVNVEV